MLKGVFFDLFGTLMMYTDMEKAWERWLKALYKGLQETGLKMSQESFKLKCDGFFAKPKPEIKNLKLSVYENRIYSLGCELKLQLEIEDIEKIVYNTINAWQEYVPLDPNTIPVLTELKKNKFLALITNFDHPPHVYSLLTEKKLINFFDSIIISSEVGVKKPDPLIFSHVLKDTALKPREICYVGDTNEDMEAAIKAEIYPILIQRNPNSDKEIPDDYYVKSSQNFQNDINVNLKSVKRIKSLRELIKIVN
ncbi:MAG: HAD family hydrolase [Promethearchaeota archaeon]